MKIGFVSLLEAISAVSQKFGPHNNNPLYGMDHNNKKYDKQGQSSTPTDILSQKFLLEAISAVLQKFGPRNNNPLYGMDHSNKKYNKQGQSSTPADL